VLLFDYYSINSRLHTHVARDGTLGLNILDYKRPQILLILGSNLGFDKIYLVYEQLYP